MVTKFKRFRKGEFRQTIFFYIFLGILVLIIVGFLVTSNLKINKKRNELLTQINYLEKEIQILEEKKAKYESGIFQAETKSFWEEKIREQGYNKPGEEVVVVLPPEESQEGEAKKEKTFWGKILEILNLRQ